jgi:DNA transformation protein
MRQFLKFFGENMMGELSKLINIGEKVEKQLNEAGIKTIDELKKIGSRNAWLKIRRIDLFVLL